MSYRCLNNCVKNTVYSDSWVRSSPNCKWCNKELVQTDKLTKSGGEFILKGSGWPSKDIKNRG